MKILIYIIVSIFFINSLFALEKTKEEKVAKFVIENIQKDYTSCYSFYKIASESFKNANAEKSIINGLEKSADVTLKFAHDLGEVLNYKPKIMSENNKKEIKKLSIIAKKDFNQLAEKYGIPMRNFDRNAKEWEFPNYDPVKEKNFKSGGYL